jgi:flagellar basal-body rod modification protein FlgD
MTAVSSVPGISNVMSTSSTPSKNSVDYDSFLTLLVAQMKNQDPMSPMESTDYIAQLATFSQVEQSIQMNTKLDSMLQANTLSQATGLIGKEVESMDGTVKGTVTAVELYSDGVVAFLADGQKVAMTPGVVVRNAPQEQAGEG